MVEISVLTEEEKAGALEKCRQDYFGTGPPGTDGFLPDRFGGNAVGGEV
jgi:hypothetical protein